MLHRGSHLPLLHDKMPVYSLKYLKFITITLFPLAWRLKPLQTLPNWTTFSLPQVRFNSQSIFTHSLPCYLKITTSAHY